MKKIYLEQLGKEISVIGLGTMIFHPKKQELIFDLLDYFVKEGGNLIDTAEIYGDPEEYGYSEQALGTWLEKRGNRKDVVILTKGCIPGTCKPIYPNGSEISPEGINKSITGSLERLKTDYIDIWMLHRDDPNQTVGPLMEALHQEVKDGRILSFGVSNWETDRINEALKYSKENNISKVAASSPHFSLATAKEPYWPGAVVTYEKDAEWYRENNIPLFAWSSLGRGFFGYGDPNYTEDENLVRVFYNDENFEKLNRAKKLAKEKNVSIIEVALSYVINQKFPVVALVGPANVDELKSCINSVNLRLNEDEIKWLGLKDN